MSANETPKTGRIAYVRPVVLKAIKKTPKTVAALAAAATKELGWNVDQRTVRLAIDSLRAGSKTRAKVTINRVAPNTFAVAE